ncbi:MAG: iron transporter FeoB [Gracilibacter sp. BRH_c7a]|nr:MAG: iron transporter FeoB [Gracilibacter sp. BRH_c7a]
MNVGHKKLLREHFGIKAKSDQYIIALAGNPNVGKSTVFNALTGLRQHTGNWPGKTVDNAQGSFSYQNIDFLMVDLPGTYSILTNTVEEEIARDFICFAIPDVTIVVLDATSLERNLNIALQVMEITPKVIVCVNLMDEAQKNRIVLDLPGLEKELGVPVIGTSARQGIGLDKLKEVLYLAVKEQMSFHPRQLQYSQEVEKAIEQLLPKIEQFGLSEYLNPRWLALRLLDSDQMLTRKVCAYLSANSEGDIYKEVSMAL